jgi:hypothetical protein
MASLTIAEYKRFGFACPEDESDLHWLLNEIDSMVKDEIGDLFSLTTIGEGETLEYIDYEGKNMDFRKIGAWQESGLTIQLGRYYSGFPNLETLVEHTDYVLEHYNETKHPTLSRPVIGVRMLRPYVKNYTNYNGYQANILTDDYFLRVTGTLGWQEGYPARLKNALYRIVNNNLQYTQNMAESGGKGIAESVKSRTIEDKYKTSTGILESQRNMAFNPMEDPTVRSAINHYRKFATANQTKLTR